jgi:hypothetical protein
MGAGGLFIKGEKLRIRGFVIPLSSYAFMALVGKALPLF